MTHFVKKLSAATLLFAIAHAATAADVKVKLSGDQETPAVTTTASGSGSVSVGADKSISGTFKTKGIVEPTMAHIHTGAAGQKGPPAITLSKVSDSEWTVPAGTVLSDEDFENFKEGKLYVNVHTAANKGGEIRGQITP